MSRSGSTPPRDPSHDLFTGWSLEEDSGDARESEDSLWAPPRASGRDPLGLGVGKRRSSLARSPSKPRNDVAGLIAEFSIGDAAAPTDQSIAPPSSRADRGSATADARAALPFPNPGDVVAGFGIVSELGRGAFARVYLAEQLELGKRLVALKVSRPEGTEPQMLARLQHSHIVPIHSVFDDPVTRLRLLCMPYLGGANLAQVLEAAGTAVPSQATGRSLVTALDAVGNRLATATRVRIDACDPPSPLSDRSRSSLSRYVVPAGSPRSSPGSLRMLRSFWARVPGWRRIERRPGSESRPGGAGGEQPAREFLAAVNYVEAAVWIIACLAEGLDHAHSRGLLHRDLKPSNVLIAADGTPMLLDFNLSTAVALPEAEEGAQAMIGGTLPYMAPEHLDAFDPSGTTAPEDVNERADLYSLGLILFEMIAGRQAFPDPPPNAPLLDVVRFMIQQRRQPPSLRAVCPQVSWGLDAVVAKCLDFDPGRRYARARDLAEDLRRHLDHQPFKHIPEPSTRERLAKWARRNPRFCGNTSVAVLVLALAATLGGFTMLLVENLRNVAARLQWQTFQDDFNKSQFLLNITCGPDEHLRPGLERTRRMLDRVGRVELGAWRPSPWVQRLTPPEQTKLREESAELILLEARARTYLAERTGTERDRDEALTEAIHGLDRAEQLDPRPPAALFGDRARYHSALGNHLEAARDRRREAQTPLTSSRDFALLGTALLGRGDLRAAESALRRAVGLDTRAFWAWFALGQCHFNQGRYLEAEGDFAVCTALEPRFAWPHLNRGLSLAHAGRLDEALACHDRALQANPRFAEALVDRALVLLELNAVERAERDLKAAVALGRNDAGVLAALGEASARLGHVAEAERLFADLLSKAPRNPVVLVARGAFRLARDPSAARADFEAALDLKPRDPRAHLGMAKLLYRERKDLSAALEHLEAALDAAPDLIDAVELRALTRARLGDTAAIDDVERLRMTPTPHRLYNAACTLAILTETAGEDRLAPRALALLGEALKAGFAAEEVRADADWKPFLARRDFQELIQKAAAPKNRGPCGVVPHAGPDESGPPFHVSARLSKPLAAGEGRKTARRGELRLRLVVLVRQQARRRAGWSCPCCWSGGGGSRMATERTVNPGVGLLHRVVGRGLLESGDGDVCAGAPGGTNGCG